MKPECKFKYILFFLTHYWPTKLSRVPVKHFSGPETLHNKIVITNEIIKWNDLSQFHSVCNKEVSLPCDVKFFVLVCFDVEKKNDVKRSKQRQCQDK